MFFYAYLFLLLTRLELQSHFGDNWGHTTWNLSGLSPKRDWSSERVNKYIYGFGSRHDACLLR